MCSSLYGPMYHSEGGLIIQRAFITSDSTLIYLSQEAVESEIGALLTATLNDHEGHLVLGGAGDDSGFRVQGSQTIVCSGTHSLQWTSMGPIVLPLLYSTYYKRMGNLHYISSEQGGELIIRTELIYYVLRFLGIHPVYRLCSPI